MRIIFLRAFDFPIGGAAANRLLGICKALQFEGVNASVCQYAPSKSNEYLNCLKKQVYQGIEVRNLSYQYSPISKKSDFYLGIFVGILKTALFIFKENRKIKIDYININSTNLFVLSFFKVVGKILKIKFCRDLNEYPKYVINKTKKPFFADLSYLFFDKIFCISHFLIDFYQPKLSAKTQIDLLPMTVDEDRFDCQSSSSILNSKLITYCGDLSQSKDGIFDMIHAFSRILKTYPKYILQIIGINDNKIHMEEIYHLVKHLNIENSIIFSGLISPVDIPSYLSKSRLLLLCRPKSIQAQGGFPTKLGEYLLTGIPVVLTNVGEISLYLENNVSAYISEPSDIDSIAENIKFALIQEQKSIEIGLKGRKVALNHFSYKVQGAKLLTFLKK